MIYEYTNMTVEPNLSKIREDVLESAMTDKNIENSNWSEDENKLYVTFTSELSSGDKTILDGIVSNSVGYIRPQKLRTKIIGEIYDAISSTEQMGRLIQAFRKYPDLILFLDNFNYPGATSVIYEIYNAGEITESDRDMILSKFPS